jgi:signal transduction histidine kinase/PAS domain-containing protein
MPPGVAPTPREDPEYPAPNLYGLVLSVNSEVGLDSWWSALARIMYEGYGIERMSLAVPADAGELENVPWGQRATFSFSGAPEAHRQDPHIDSNRRKFSEASLQNIQDESSSIASPTSGRPKLQARHSYAGYERASDASTSHPATGRLARPRGPLRATSYIPALPTIGPIEEYDGQSEVTLRESTFFPPPDRRQSQLKSFSDLDYSILGSEKPPGPFTEVVPVLRALNHEAHALLDTAGVNKILDRGKLVTLTRDYSNEASSRRQSATPQQAAVAASAQPARPAPPPESKATSIHASEPKNLLHKLTAEYFTRPKIAPAYEEYEQFPTSPWAQSPAPSPAIQADPEENPFFASGDVDEDSFNPREGTPQDYSKVEQVEAIGIDKASTVIHIPLIHPVLSQEMPPRESPHGTNTPTGRGPDKKSEAPSTPLSDQTPRLAPLAILSVLSPIVPYPQNLIQSLKLFAPHLATSFSNAQQYSNVHRQATGFHRRSPPGPNVGIGATDSGGLENLMEADLDVSNGSATGSITSPSDYSGRSRPSPGSIAGTPGWDSMNITFSGRPSVGNTPAHMTGSEMIDSYFDMKKRKPLHHTESSSATPQAKKDLSPSPQERLRPTQGLPSDENRDAPRSDPRMGRRTVQDERRGRGDSSPQMRVRIGSPKRKVTAQFPEKPKQQHTLLHSYGADFSSSFQSLPAAATPSTRTPGISGISGITSPEQTHEMPPPSERLLRTIIDALPVQIFTAAPGTGTITWVNSKFLVYRGQDARHILQDPWEALHPDDRDHYVDEWQKCLSTGQQFSHKVRLKRFDNAFRWFYVRATPLMDKKLKIVHWAGTNMDIHEQHIAEMNAARQQETAASEAKYRALANSSPQIVFAVSRTRGVTFCNSQWPTYSGQTEEQARGLGFMDYVYPEDLAKCRLPTFNEDGTLSVDIPTSLPPDVRRLDSSRSSSDDSSETSKTITSPGAASPAAVAMPQAKLSKLASAGILKVARDPDGRPSYSTEVRLRSKESDYRWHLVRVLLSEPVRKDDSDEDETWYGTCTDINDHKVLEQTLKDTMDAKSRFLSNMSHEIRTPLNGITGMVNFLIDSNLTAEQMEHVNIIRNSTEGLRDLINDILDLSKVEAGMVTLQLEWMHIPSLIEEVNDLTSAMAIDKGLELNYIVEDDVPSMAKGDRFRIRQVLLNVVGNAIKFTQHGEVFVRCSIDSNRGDDEEPITLKDYETLIKFEVIDTGAGFTEEEARFLFKRFSQIDSSSTKQHSGTGLGLAISMQLVELHGGRMKASSRPGEGSTFTFSIKFSLPTAKDRPAAPASEAVTPTFVPPVPEQAVVSPEKGLSPAVSPVMSRRGTDSPAISISSTAGTHKSAASSGSSDPSIRTTQTSIGSAISSASSTHSADVAFPKGPPMVLELPSDGRGRQLEEDSTTPSSQASADTIRPVSSAASHRAQTHSPLRPQLFSILVVCPMPHAREATVKHIEQTIPKSTPHHITPRANLVQCEHMFSGEDPVIFTHVVLILRHVDEIIAFLDKVIPSTAHSSTSMLIITDLAQKRDIIANSKQRYDFNKLQAEARVRFLFKPSKPSKFALIFDPQKEREVSADSTANSAQAVAVSQKQVFDELKKRLGGRDFRVLLVEDNKTNQMVREISKIYQAATDGYPRCSKSSLRRSK